MDKKLSEEGKWFLRNLQKIQDDFADSIGGQIVTTDKEGNLVTEMSGAQKVCQMIQSTEEGKNNCSEAYNTALSLVKEKEDSIFMNCHAGYASLWVPIKVDGDVVGSITGCGGRFDEGKSDEELREEFTKLADDLEINEKEKFLKYAVDDTEPVDKEEIKKRATRLSKLVSVLAEETALSEVFS